MTSRLAVMTAVLVTAVLFTTVVAPSLTIGGQRPDAVLLVVLAFALADGPGTGARYGFVAGLVADLLAATDQLVGVGTLLFLVAGYVVGVLRPYLAGTELVGEIAVTAAASAAVVVLRGLIGVVIPEFGGASGVSLLRDALVLAAYHAALTPVVVRPVVRLARRYPGTVTVE